MDSTEHRFAIIPDKELQDILENKDSLNTKKAMNYAVKCNYLYNKVINVYNKTIIGLYLREYHRKSASEVIFASACGLSEYQKAYISMI